MKLTPNAVALGSSIVAMLVSLFALGFSMKHALPLGSANDSTPEADIVLKRMSDLGQENTELREAVALTLSRLQNAETMRASAEDRLAKVTGRLDEVEESVGVSAEDVRGTVIGRLATLEESSATARRTLRGFGSTLTTMEKSGEKTDAKVETESDDTPKLEDYLSIDLNPINGLPGPHIIIEGANLHIRSGSGSTDDLGGALFGLGNLVVGYNELDQTQARARNGSHNLIIGSGHGYSSFGGLLAGFANQVNAPNSSVTGGTGNAANGWASSISGGQGNLATQDASSVSGGLDNQAVAKNASVTGGSRNTASGLASSVTGGQRNSAIADASSVTGGAGNRTLSDMCSVSGGVDIALNGEGFWQGGTLPIGPK